MKKIIIGIVAAILICTVAYSVILTVFWDIDIMIGKPASYAGKYVEPIIIAGGNIATARAKENASDFSNKCGEWMLAFYEEYKDDEYKIDTYVTFEDGKTIVTHKGTITDKETKETTPYEDKLVFDYIFTKTIIE